MCFKPFINCYKVLKNAKYGGLNKILPTKKTKHTHCKHKTCSSHLLHIQKMSWISVRGPVVEMGKFPVPPQFSWKPCDETKGGGRKLNALCDLCVFDTCVLPEAHCFSSLCEIFSGCGLVCSWSVLSILVCTGTFPLSGSGSLSWIYLHLCCWTVSGGLLHLSTVFLGLLAGCVFVFVDLLPPVLYGVIGVLCWVQTSESSLWCHPLTDYQRCRLKSWIWWL